MKEPIFPIEMAIHSFIRIQSYCGIFEKKENLCIDITPYGHKWREKNAFEFIQKHGFSDSSSSNKDD